MDTLMQAESLAAYALGQRRGFILGLACGAALVIYASRYKTVRRAHSEPVPTTGRGF